MSNIVEHPEVVARKNSVELAFALVATTLRYLEGLARANAKFAAASLPSGHAPRNPLRSAAHAHEPGRHAATYTPPTFGQIQSYWSDIRDLTWGTHLRFVGDVENLLARHVFDALDIIDKWKRTSAASGELTMATWHTFLPMSDPATTGKAEMPKGAAG